VSLRRVSTLLCSPRRPNSPARDSEVATVAVSVQTCTVTTGGHRGVSSMVGEGKEAWWVLEEKVTCRGASTARWPHVHAQQKEVEGSCLHAVCPKEGNDG
jgi:hypothetical protein